VSNRFDASRGVGMSTRDTPSIVRLRNRHRDNPHVYYRASDIHSQTLIKTDDPDQLRRNRSIMARLAVELGTVLAAQRGADSCGQGGAV
jgi:hypothetical protein